MESVLMGKIQIEVCVIVGKSVTRPVMRRADFNNSHKAKGHTSCVLSLNSSKGNKVPMHHYAFESCPKLHNIKVFCITEVWVLLESCHTELETKKCWGWGRLLLTMSQISAPVEAEAGFVVRTKARNSYLCHIIQAVEDVLASFFRFDPCLYLMVLRCLQKQTGILSALSWFIFQDGSTWKKFIKHWRSAFNIRNTPRVHPQMQLHLLNSHVDLNLFDFLSFVEHERRYFAECR